MFYNCAPDQTSLSLTAIMPSNCGWANAGDGNEAEEDLFSLSVAKPAYRKMGVFLDDLVGVDGDVLLDSIAVTR